MSLIPTNIRVPFVYVAFDPTRAFQGPSILKYQALLIGQKTSSGTKPEKQLDIITDPTQGQSYYGPGSQLDRIIRAWFENNKTTTVYAMCINDAGAAVAATKTITVSVTTALAGTLRLLINGVAVNVAVAAGDADTAIASNIVAAITANTLLPYTAAAVDEVVTLTSKNAGEEANDIDVRVNYNPGEKYPGGVSVVIADGTSGATNPDVDDVIAELGDEWFNVIVLPWVDASNLTKIETEMVDRAGPIRMIDGMVYISKRGTPAQLTTFGSGRNSPYVSCRHCEKIPNGTAEFAASVAGQEAASAENDPAVPMQTLPLVGILPPKMQDRFSWSENNDLLFSGVSTFYVDNGGVVRIQASITMYQTNVVGAADIAYYKTNTVYTVMFMRYDFRTRIRTKYPRAKLGDDGQVFPSGQQIITPKIGKAEAVAIFKSWQEDLGIAENIDQFINDLQCVRNVSDPNRLDWLLPPDLVNQFDVGGAVIQFLLQSPTSA